LTDITNRSETRGSLESTGADPVIEALREKDHISCRDGKGWKLTRTAVVATFNGPGSNRVGVVNTSQSSKNGPPGVLGRIDTPIQVKSVLARFIGSHCSDESYLGKIMTVTT
jgi:hypothetical protein